METTAIYANAVGEEQQSIAARMWMYLYLLQLEHIGAHPT
jgi:hypothetical protein